VTPDEWGRGVWGTKRARGATNREDDVLSASGLLSPAGHCGFAKRQPVRQRSDDPPSPCVSPSTVFSVMLKPEAGVVKPTVPS
jgi:hypothetical protein